MHGATHVEGGPDPIPGLARPPSGDTIDAIVEGLDPAGFWKLNESSGSVAADSSGNGLDLTADTGPPLWAAAAGPPGEQTANFENGTGGSAARVARTWAAMNTDFTAGLWTLRNPTAPADGSPNLHSTVMGQGNPSRSGGTGWEMGFEAFNEFGGPSSLANLPYAALKGAGGVYGLNPILDTDGWHFLALTYDATAHQMKLYVNGLLQQSASASAYTPVPGSSALWVGHDAGLGGSTPQPCKCTLSYAFVVPSVLSGADLLSIYDSAVLPAGANEGKALLATGLGATYWDFAIEVTY